MRIGIDARPLSCEHAGVYRYLAQILQRLARIDDTNDYCLYSRSDFDLTFENSRWQKHLYPRRLFHPSSFWFQTGVRTLITRHDVDVFWGTSGVFPLGLPSEVPKVLTVYDLVWHFYPETMSTHGYLGHRLFAARSIRDADKIITISESVAHDLQNVFALSRNKIFVVYPAPDTFFVPHERGNAACYIAQKYGTSKKYICTVGTVEPRKDLITLIEAMKILKDRNQCSGQLLIAGASGWKDSSIHKWVKSCGLAEREIRFLGYLPDEDLPRLYSGASLFVFPSLYEGFGIPLIEAMACGAPIVASNVPAIMEVVQDAGILVSPRDAAGFAEAIARVTDHPEVARSLTDKGFRRARTFCWERTAQNVLDVLGSFH